MYLTQRGLEPLVTAAPTLDEQTPAPSTPRRRLRPSGLGANVMLLGLTSLVTDVATEMVTAILRCSSRFASGSRHCSSGPSTGQSN